MRHRIVTRHVGRRQTRVAPRPARVASAAQAQAEEAPVAHAEDDHEHRHAERTSDDPAGPGDEALEPHQSTAVATDRSTTAPDSVR